MTAPLGSPGSNPLAGGSGAAPSPANPLAGGQANNPPAQTGTNPAAGAGSNPLAGGSSAGQATSPDDENAPVPADVYREKARAEAALRKRLSEIESQLKAQEDAKLTEGERDKKRISDLERERDEYLLDRQDWRLQRVVDAEAGSLRLTDARDAMYLLKRDYGDQIEYDDDGNPTNVPWLLKRMTDKKPWLVWQEQQPQAQNPSSGRYASPPRPGTPRPPTPPEPKPLGPQDSLGQIDWSQVARRQGT